MNKKKVLNILRNSLATLNLSDIVVNKEDYEIVKNNILEKYLNNSFGLYFVGGSSILRNHFNSNDDFNLRRLEIRILLEKLSLMNLNPVSNNMDLNHLIKINSILLNDIYFFDGMYSIINNKNYLNCEKDEIEMILNQMNSEIKHLSYNDYQEFLAFYYYKFIMLKPFIKGNEITIREFLREFVIEMMPCLELDYEMIDKINMLEGIRSHLTNPKILSNEFDKALILKK